MVKITSVDLVYPAGPGISAPQTIGRHLAEELSADYDVRLHRWDDIGRIKARRDAALIGHPHPFAATTFRRSLRGAWGRTIAMMPVHAGELAQVAYADAAIRRVDHLLAITGNHWFARLPDSALGHWAPKSWHLDLAVDRLEFPRVKDTFAPPGQRKILYVGSTAWCKSPKYLSAIVDRLPGVECGWIGPGRDLRGFIRHGVRDFSTAGSQALVRGHDISITAGAADANPTTILESAAWGLLSACPPTSGYSGEPGMTSIPFGNPDAAAKVLRELLMAPTEHLLGLRAAMDARLDSHFTWARFAQTVRSAIETERKPACPTSPHRGRFIASAATSRLGPFRTTGLTLRKQAARRRVGQTLPSSTRSALLAMHRHAEHV